MGRDLGVWKSGKKWSKSWEIGFGRKIDLKKFFSVFWGVIRGLGCVGSRMWGAGGEISGRDFVFWSKSGEKVGEMAKNRFWLKNRFKTGFFGILGVNKGWGYMGT